MLHILLPLRRQIRKHRTLKGMLLVGALSLLALVLLGSSNQDESEEEERSGGGPDLLLAAERRLSQLQLSSEEVFRALHGSLSAVTLRRGCSSVARVGGLCTCRLTSWSDADSTWNGVWDGAKLVCLDLLPEPGAACTVLSAGINHDFSFEAGMTELGCDVSAFDPTMGEPSHQVAPRLRFYDVGVGATDGAVRSARGATFPVRSLAALLELIGAADGVVDYVKLDVESSEWGVFERLLAAGGGALGRVRQLAVELHLRQWEPELSGQSARPLTEARARRCLRVLFGLQLLGFQLAGSMHGEGMCVQHAGRDDSCVSAAYETLWVNTNASGVS